jgi:hypothetical protein
MIDRQIFFDKIRAAPFNGSLGQSTVNGCNAILGEWERRGLPDLRHLAYMLATVRGECGADMWPIHEIGGHSYFDKYDFGTSLGARLGNTVPGDGYKYRGRGFVQLTGRSNYTKMQQLTGVGLVDNPDLALSPATATKVMFEGMARGTFTGKKLSDYLNDTITDWVNARRIINGTDKAAKFAEWAKQFHSALIAASKAGVAAPPPPPVPKPPKKSNTAAGAAAGTVAAGGAVIASQTSKQGANVGQLVAVGVLIAIIAVAVFLIIRNWRKP